MTPSRLVLVAAIAALTLCTPPADAAFNVVNLQCDNSTRSQDQPRVCTYKSATDSLATIKTANYFTSSTDPKQRLLAKDLLFVVGSDGSALLTVTSASKTANVVAPFSSAVSPCINPTVTFDPAATTFGSLETKAVTATGAALGQSCQVIAPYSLQALVADCYVSGTNAATITLLQPGVRLNGSTTWNPTNVDDGDMESKDVTVTGAALGDPVACAFSLDVLDLQLTGSVTATNVATCTLSNSTGAAVDLASGTVTAAVQDVSASAVDLASGSWTVHICPVP